MCCDHVWHHEDVAAEPCGMCDTCRLQAVSLYLHASRLHGIQQVVQGGLLGLLGKEVKFVQDKDDHFVAAGQLLQHRPKEIQILRQ